MEIWKYGNVEISKYRKHERRTMLGKQCQIWDADYPWQNKFNDEPKHMYDNQLTEDLCRNAYIEGGVTLLTRSKDGIIVLLGDA